MHIECRTTSAASQVVLVLIDAQLRPGKEFHMDGPNLPDPPVSFIIHVTPLSQVMRRLQSISETTIAGKRTA